ncbi:hypothetical protein JTB14_014937 [Gonioctena quinquepunctata]|nr:hypothetical protein JTB14_014937 [Gonioctena quinquepunctata]
MVVNAPSFLKKIVRKLNAKTYDSQLRFSGIKCTLTVSNKRLDIAIRSNTHENFRLKVSCAVLPQNKVSLLCQNACEAGDSLDKILAKFWEVEELPKFKSSSADEELAEQSFIQTHVRLENGNFQVDFPFKRPGEKIPLGDSFHIAKRRFTNLEKRFQNSKELFSDYKKFIDEYVSSKHATYIPFNPTDKSAEIKYFLPHHCVIKDSSETTKLR